LVGRNYAFVSFEIPSVESNEFRFDFTSFQSQSNRAMQLGEIVFFHLENLGDDLAGDWVWCPDGFTPMGNSDVITLRADGKVLRENITNY
jgi:hypothetical protein